MSIGDYPLWFTPHPLPGPFKCPDCGTWWAGYQHVCAKPVTWHDTTPNTYTAKCNCPKDRQVGTHEVTFCPIHDIKVTYVGS